MHTARDARHGVAVGALVWASFACRGLACPICDSGTGAQVRAGLFDGAFLVNLLSAAAPFAIFGAIAALVHFRWRD